MQVSKILDPADHMFNSGPDWYWSVGESGLLAVQRVLGLTYTKDVHRVMDLPCGHGRVARYLRCGFPSAEMFYCDLDHSGADFCAKEFNGTAIHSKPELTDIDLPGDLDVIWVGSLFTHLDRDRTRRWLSHLCSKLSRQGVLVATFHGPFAIEVNRKNPMIDSVSWEAILSGYHETGYGYAKYDYMKDDYGISLSRPSVVIDMVEAIPNVRLLSYTERGWADNHDVLGISGDDRLKSW